MASQLNPSGKTGDDAVVLFPGALGDFLCFVPTLNGLRKRHDGRLLLVAKPSHLGLVRLPNLDGHSIDAREVSDLFASRGDIAEATRSVFAGHAHAYSWTGSGDPNLTTRLAAATGGTVHVYPFRGMRKEEHACDYYARCALVDATMPSTTLISRDETWLRSFLRRHGLQPKSFVIVHPGSGSRRKNWQGFGDLVRACRERIGTEVVVLCGPADRETVAGLESFTVADVSLSQVAALLAAASGYVGNDSGISHLAGAAGSSGVVLFGPTDPAVWAPRGKRLRVRHAPTPCPACGPEVFCTHRLPVSAVLEDLLETARSPDNATVRKTTVGG